MCWLRHPFSIESWLNAIMTTHPHSFNGVQLARMHCIDTCKPVFVITGMLICTICPP